jgi:hypothetical protein
MLQSGPDAGPLPVSDKSRQEKGLQGTVPIQSEIQKDAWSSPEVNIPATPAVQDHLGLGARRIRTVTMVPAFTTPAIGSPRHAAETPEQASAEGIHPLNSKAAVSAPEASSIKQLAESLNAMRMATWPAKGSKPRVDEMTRTANFKGKIGQGRYSSGDIKTRERSLLKLFTRTRSTRDERLGGEAGNEQPKTQSADMNSITPPPNSASLSSPVLSLSQVLDSDSRRTTTSPSNDSDALANSRRQRAARVGLKPPPSKKGIAASTAPQLRLRRKPRPGVLTISTSLISQSLSPSTAPESVYAPQSQLRGGSQARAPSSQSTVGGASF